MFLIECSLVAAAKSRTMHSFEVSSSAWTGTPPMTLIHPRKTCVFCKWHNTSVHGLSLLQTTVDRCMPSASHTVDFWSVHAQCFVYIPSHFPVSQCRYHVGWFHASTKPHGQKNVSLSLPAFSPSDWKPGRLGLRSKLGKVWLRF